MKCDKCGNERDEAEVEPISLSSGDKIICRECMLDLVYGLDSAGLIEWQEEEHEDVDDCPRDIPLHLRGKANACLAGGPRTKQYPGGQFCLYLESIGKCKFEGSEKVKEAE